MCVLIVDDDNSSDAYHLVQFAGLCRRQVDASVAAAVDVDVASEIGSPAGVMQTIAAADKRHPVADETLVVCLAFFLAAAS